MRIKLVRCGIAALSVLLTACESMPTQMTTTPTEQSKSLGMTEGSACGSIALFGTLYNFIPIGLNSRVETAYNRALQKKPGATTLVNITVQENWYWWVIGTARCVKVTGEAVQ